MKFCIDRGVLGNCPLLEISSEEFQGLKEAKRRLFILVGVEEKFDMLVQNYLEYEQVLLTLALEHMVSHNTEYSTTHDARSLINRRLANLLTMARLYIDQVKHDVSRLFGPDAAETSLICQSFRTQYDSLLGYRLLEAIRNSMQHRELPISSLVYPSVREDRGNAFVIRHQVVARISVEHLRADSKLKPVIVAELQERGDWHDITPFVREYVEGIARVHEGIRSATDEFVRPWSDMLHNALRNYSTLLNQSVSRAVVYRLTDDDNEAERFAIFTEVIDRLKRLRSMGLPTRISQWFVTSETVR